jgi:predicted house-cleaning noncanonical NTP pyrophosphatase (MazG superfamily)
MVTNNNKKKLDESYKNFEEGIDFSLLKVFKHDFVSYLEKTLFIDLDAVECIRVRKKEERGGFDERLFCYLIILKKGDPFYSITIERKSTKVTISGHEAIFKDYESFSCAKLVRDNVARRAVEKNRVVFWRRLDDEEYFTALCEKLREEYEEFSQSNTQKEIKEEDADVFEVIYALEKSFFKE